MMIYGARPMGRSLLLELDNVSSATSWVVCLSVRFAFDVPGLGSVELHALFVAIFVLPL